MGNVPNRPIDQYPVVAPDELPPVPPGEAGGGEAVAPAPREREQAAEVAALDFLDRAAREVPLAFPFMWDGQRVETIVVRRLLTSQVAELTAGGRVPAVFDAYAAMTGFPASVLRGLDGDDGTAVAEAAFDFLPRLWQAVYSA